MYALLTYVVCGATGRRAAFTGWAVLIGVLYQGGDGTQQVIPWVPFLALIAAAFEAMVASLWKRGRG